MTLRAATDEAEIMHEIAAVGEARQTRRYEAGGRSPVRTRGRPGDRKLNVPRRYRSANNLQLADGDRQFESTRTSASWIDVKNPTPCLAQRTM